MSRRKILIISRSFYPHISPRSFRTTELVKNFAKQGHDVTILTHKNNIDKIYKDFEKEFNVSIKDLGKIFLPRIRLGKNKYINLFKRSLSRILNLLFEYPDIELIFLIKKALKKEKGFDLLISIAVPHSTHWGVALALNKEITKTWVADCGDPFMGATTDSFRKLFYFKYIEKWWSKKANYITVPITGAIQAYYEEFHYKIKVIPQGVSFNEIVINENNYKPHEVPTFAYIGLLIPKARDPRYLIEYLLSLKIEFKFILYNKQKGMFLDLIKKANGMVEFKNYIERNKLLNELSKMDFLVNFNNSVTTQLPSKLIDYYLTKRPVLSLNSFDIDKKNIQQFLKKDYSNKHIFLNMNDYNITNVCNEFIALCD